MQTAVQRRQEELKQKMPKEQDRPHKESSERWGEGRRKIVDEESEEHRAQHGILRDTITLPERPRCGAHQGDARAPVR